MSVNGNISITSIEPSDTIPPGCTARINVQVVLNSDSDELPSNATAQLAIITGSAYISGASKRNLVKEKGSQPVKYNAVFYVNIDGSTLPNSIITTQASTSYIDNGTKDYAKRITVSDNILRNYLSNGITFCELSEEGSQPPEQPVPLYALMATNNDGEPVPDGTIIEWGLAWPSNTFDGVLLYADSSFSEPLQPDISVARPNGVVRSETISGIARLYVVPNGRQSYMKVVGQPASANPFLFNDLIIFDPSIEGTLVQPQISLTYVNGAYDLDSVNGDFVDVTINRNNNSFQNTNRVMLFLNNKANFNTYVSSTGFPLDVKVSKTSFSKKNNGNTLYYIIANQYTSNIFKSVDNVFSVTGSSGNLIPDNNLSPRILLVPTVYNSGYYVNTYTIATGNLVIGIPIKQDYWNFAAGDIISATIYLNGYSDVDDNAIMTSYIEEKIITEDDIAGSAEKIEVLFNSIIVSGYNSGMDGPGAFYAEYNVYRPTNKNLAYSKWVQKALDTSSPGGI